MMICNIGWCRWDDIEAEDYLKYVTDQDYRRQKTPWQMDLNWLTDKGYVIPPQLRHLCCAQKAENVLEQRSEVPGSRTKKFIKKSYSKSRCLIQ